MIQALSQIKQAQDIVTCAFIGCILLIAVLSYNIKRSKIKRAEKATV